MADNPLAAGGGIWAMAGRPTVALKDPNESLRDVLATQQGVYNNRVVKAQLARGDLMQQAIDPVTGAYSPGKFNALAANDPDVAPAMADAIPQSQTLMGAQTDLGIKQNSYLNQILPAALNLPPEQRNRYLAGALGGALNTNTVSQQVGANAMAALPTDPTQQGNQLQALQLSTMPAGQQRAVTFGTPGDQSDGQNVIAGVRADPSKGGGFTSGSVTPVFPSRGELAGQVAGVDAQGRPIQQTLGGRLQDQGRSDLGGPAATPPGALPPALLPPGYNGRYRTGSATPAAATPVASVPPSAATPPSEAAPEPSGSVPTGLAPGQADEAAASVTHLAAARDAANGYQARMQPLLSAQTALADAKTGAGSDTLNRVRQLVGSFTPTQFEGLRNSMWLGSTQGDASFDEARKYLTNYAANTPGANRSDSGAATAAHANASVEISPEAAKQVVKAAIGMERMKQAQLLEFNAGQQPGSTYDRYQAEAASKADPRAFMADQQTPAERKAMIGSMNPTQQANYLSGVRLAMKHGLMTLPGYTPAAAPAAPAAPALAPGQRVGGSIGY